MVRVADEEWPPYLRSLLLRERQRVLDLFRHWEGGDHDPISAEHFKAGLHVLGFSAPRAEVLSLYAAMGAEGKALPYSELRRQLRVVAAKGLSAYLRDAARRGAALEAEMPRGATMSSVVMRILRICRHGSGMHLVRAHDQRYHTMTSGSMP